MSLDLVCTISLILDFRSGIVNLTSPNLSPTVSDLRGKLEQRNIFFSPKISVRAVSLEIMVTVRASAIDI